MDEERPGPLDANSLLAHGIGVLRTCANRIPTRGPHWLFLSILLTLAACYETSSPTQGATDPPTSSAPQMEPGVAAATTADDSASPPVPTGDGSVVDRTDPGSDDRAAVGDPTGATATNGGTTDTPATIPAATPSDGRDPVTTPSDSAPVDGVWTDPDEDPPRLVDALLALHETLVIERGDSVLSLAAESGCRVTDFVRANPNLNPSALLQPGARLNLPECARRVLDDAPRQGGTYDVQSGDYLALIASAAGCSVSEVLQANGLSTDSITTGDQLRIPECDEPDGEPHPLSDGESIEDVASANGCSVGEVVEASRLPSSDSAIPGTVVYLPDNCRGEPRPAAVPLGPVPVLHDHETLEALMNASGFDAPRRFKAVVVEFSLDGSDGPVILERRFDWRGTGDDFDDWNPASSVKLFSAIGAAWRVQQLGFSSRANVVFDGQAAETSVDELISLALIPSDNIAHNRLVQIAGFDPMHRELFTPANGFAGTALTRPYARGTWMELGESSSLRSAPSITISEEGRSVTLDAGRGTTEVQCTRAACTSLGDLAEAMKQLMLADQLPAGTAVDIAETDRLTIRRALRADRRRGNEVVDGLRAALPDAVFYHKAGFSNDWYSDTVFIGIPGSDRAWIVGLAGHPGRHILDSAARTIGTLIANGSLSATPAEAGTTIAAGSSINGSETSRAGATRAQPPERCTYRSYQWDTRSRRSTNHQEIDHPYSEVTDDERSPADPDCTVCSQDQVVIDPTELGIVDVEPIAVCWKYADSIRESLRTIHESGEFEIVQLDGYRAGRTRGSTRDGLRTEWSNHSFGAAVDINRDQNGLYRSCNIDTVSIRALRDCSLGQGGEWDPGRYPDRSIQPGGVVYREFTERVGWRWGGELTGSMRDLMHFSISGE